MVDMKALASALAMVLIGLTGVWLWLDATSAVGQDTAGVVIVSDVDPEAVTAVQVPEDPAGQDDAAADPAAGEPAVAEDLGAQAAEEQLGAADEIDDKVMAATITSLRLSLIHI